MRLGWTRIAIASERHSVSTYATLRNRTDISRETRVVVVVVVVVPVLTFPVAAFSQNCSFSVAIIVSEHTDT
jgi:uncharacterized protein (UPF0333 family)